MKNNKHISLYKEGINEERPITIGPIMRWAEDLKLPSYGRSIIAMIYKAWSLESCTYTGSAMELFIALCNEAGIYDYGRQLLEIKLNNGKLMKIGL